MEKVTGKQFFTTLGAGIWQLQHFLMNQLL